MWIVESYRSHFFFALSFFNTLFCCGLMTIFITQFWIGMLLVQKPTSHHIVFALFLQISSSLSSTPSSTHCPPTGSGLMWASSSELPLPVVQALLRNVLQVVASQCPQQCYKFSAELVWSYNYIVVWILSENPMGNGRSKKKY